MIVQARLIFTHRSHYRQCLTIGKQFHIGTAADADLILTGNQLPRHMCTLRQHRTHYDLVKNGKSRCIQWRQAYTLHGCVIELRPIWPGGSPSKLTTLACVALLGVAASHFYTRPSPMTNLPQKRSILAQSFQPLDPKALGKAIRSLSFTRSSPADYYELIVQFNEKAQLNPLESTQLDAFIVCLSEKIEELLFRISMNIGLGRQEVANSAMDELYKLLPRYTLISQATVRQKLKPLYQRIQEWQRSYEQRS